MDELIWIAAMRADPHNLMMMAAFADWLLERNDRRGEMLAMMVNDGKVGGDLGYHGQFMIGRSDSSTIGRSLFDDGVFPLYREFPELYCNTVDNRLGIMTAWATATDYRRASYLADYTQTLEVVDG